jgi:glutamate--cysteine ligase
VDAQGRYKIMREYMPKRGSLGLDMMHAHLHRAGEPGLRQRGRHGEEVPRVAGAAADRHRAVRRLAVHRRPAQRLPQLPLERLDDTDPDRTGMLGFVFEDGFGYERYVDYMLDVPMYFVYRDGQYIDASARASATSSQALAGAAGREAPR